MPTLPPEQILDEARELQQALPEGINRAHLEVAAASLRRRTLKDTLELLRRLDKSCFAKRPFVDHVVPWAQLARTLEQRLQKPAVDQLTALAIVGACGRLVKTDQRPDEPKMHSNGSPRHSGGRPQDPRSYSKPESKEPHSSSDPMPLRGGMRRWQPRKK